MSEPLDHGIVNLPLDKRGNGSLDAQIDRNLKRIAAEKIILHERFRDGRVVRDDFNVDLVVAQILREFAVLHRSEETIEETPDGRLVCGSGPEECTARPSGNPNWLRNHAANALALAEYVEGFQSGEKAKEAALTKRRDELARNAFPGRSYDSPRPTTYASLSPEVRKLIDRIIELQDQLGARS